MLILTYIYVKSILWRLVWIVILSIMPKTIMQDLQVTSDNEPPPTTQGVNPKVLDPIWDAIWTKRPVLGEIMHRKGDKSLFEYALDFYDVNPSPLLDARKEELVRVAEEILVERLGPQVAHEVADQLLKLPLVSTSDHHGPVVSTFFVNSNIMMGLHHGSTPEKAFKYLVAFSFATVSLNNVSYPRGVLFYGNEESSDSLLRLSIMPDKEKMGAVYHMRAYTKEDLDRTQSVLNDRVKAGQVSAEKAERVKLILEDYFATESVLSAKNFCEQSTRINYKLWPALFPAEKKKIPDLIYLDIETLITRVLLQVHLKDPKSLIYKLLFEPKYQEAVLKHFEGIPGGFSVEKDWGTFMFWGLDEKNHRSRLKLKDGRLSSANEQWDFEYSPEGIRKALEGESIFPSMLLCYMIVAFYYGFKCLGGFSQVSDLTHTKEAWMNMMREMGEMEEVEAVAPVQTKELNDGLTLAYLHTTQGNFIPANALDLILKGDVSFEQFVHLAQAVSFKEMMNPMVLEIYKVLYTEEQRNPEYLALNAEKLMELSGLKAKLGQLF